MIDMDIQGYTEASRIWQLGDESSIPLKPEKRRKANVDGGSPRNPAAYPVFPHAAC